MEKFSASAGSFALCEKKPEKIITFVHCGGKAACGGGKALSPANIAATKEAISEFAKALGWNEKTAETIGKALIKMQLSENPREHAKQLGNYYKKLGIMHEATVQNLEKGNSEKICSCKENSGCCIKAACADARHEVECMGKKQEEQSPKEFYFGKKLVPKKSYNETFTIAGVSPEYVKALLVKAEKREELTEWEMHNLAAVMLSTYYYCHHKWPDYEKLSAMLQK